MRVGICAALILAACILCSLLANLMGARGVPNWAIVTTNGNATSVQFLLHNLAQMKQEDDGRLVVVTTKEVRWLRG